jgi:very-short-patch-repair endonuclease/predicted transcriptional regulator of viral defense system
MNDNDHQISVPLASGRTIVVDRRLGIGNLQPLAARQGGLVSWHQLLIAGLTPSNVRTLLRRGLIVRVGWGVYRAGLISGELEPETVSLLSVGVDAVLVGRTALAVWRALTPDPRLPVTLAVYPGTARFPRSRGGYQVKRMGTLAGEDIRTYRGVRVTSVERALLDCVGLLTPGQLRDAADEAVVRRVTSRTKLARYAERHPALAELAGLARGADTGRSRYQRRALQLIRAAGLPEPETEVSIDGFTADFLFRAAGVVLEIDGFGPHGQKRANFVRDRRKDAAFRALGLVVIRVAATDLDERPYAVIADLAAAIREGLVRRRAAA